MGNLFPTKQLHKKYCFKFHESSHLEKLDENKPKASRTKEIIKMRAEVKRIENRRIIEKNPSHRFQGFGWGHFGVIILPTTSDPLTVFCPCLRPFPCHTAH